MQERSAYEVITRAKSSPIGIDWRLIRTVKEAIQHRRDFAIGTRWDKLFIPSESGNFDEANTR